eukprot:TRINITY_DN34372_c0_g1_i1.p1 TRINITY_DN34372_c0_g1~~TRINITY_DN34372_c0_g1_i1.p1  ORF type:complete len:440 (+),score=78.82 TRINITY_DN34372_c0_g1_i1:29-1321(+)
METHAERIITEEELRRHRDKGDCWVVLEGKVYDVTDFLSEHPGGEDLLLESAGADCTEPFLDTGHTSDAHAMLPGMLVGVFDGHQEIPEEKKDEIKMEMEMEKAEVMHVHQDVLSPLWTPIRRAGRLGSTPTAVPFPGSGSGRRSETAIVRTEGSFRGVSGVELFFQCWQPTRVVAKGVLLIVHGYGDHSGRYMNVVNAVVPAGYKIYAFDNRGHGRSEGMRGYVRDWKDLRGDLAIFMELVREEEGSLVPLFLYGHSFGGAIVVDLVLSMAEKPIVQGISSVILSAPALSKPSTGLLITTLCKLIYPIAPWLPVNSDIDPAALSRDPAVAGEYCRDPLTHSRASPSVVVEVHRTIERCMAHACEFTSPLLLLLPTADKLLPLQGSRTFFRTIKSERKKLCEYQGGYHEPHNDINHADVMRDVIEWMDQH